MDINGYLWSSIRLCLYKKGQGVEKNNSKAIKYFRMAAEQGDPLGMFNLGVMYYKGKGIHQDIEEALRWFERSAECGYEDAIDILKKINKVR